MECNQTDVKSALIKTKYPSHKIEDLRIATEVDNISFSKFKKIFKVECIRKTHQGYYVVLLDENGSNAFVFFNEEDELTYVIVKDRFLAKREFEAQVVKGKDHRREKYRKVQGRCPHDYGRRYLRNRD